MSALTRSGLERKTQAALAEHIADLENLETAPRDLVSRVFREQAVDAQSLARVASGLGVEPSSISKDDAPRSGGLPMSERPRRTPAWMALALATAVGTLLATAFMLGSGRGEAEIGRRTLEGFYAEIGDVYRHYLYTEEELVSDPEAAGFDLQLKLAAYGDFAFKRTEIARLGLTPDEIRWSMELLLLVRNNDLRVAEMRMASDATASVLGKQAEVMRSRMKDTRDVAYTILSSVGKRRKEFGPLPTPPARYTRVS